MTFTGLSKYKLNGSSVVSRETASVKPNIGYTERANISPSARKTETASNVSATGMSPGGITPEDLSLGYVGGSSQNRAGNSGARVPQEVYKFYDAIYREDSVCGSAIELRANIPYSDFKLIGLDAKRNQVFEDAIENMRLVTMMPRIAIDRDVQGAFLGMLDWNSAAKTYDSMLGYSRQHVSSIVYPMVHGMDPVVDVEINGFLSEIISKQSDPRMAPILKNIPNFLLQGANGASKSGGIPVPMDSIVWVERPSSDPRFNSLLHRILPIFLIERALTRGTVESAMRRQRGILHITAGSGDTWIASPEEMQSIAELFNGADADPLGAIVVTREGVSPNEVRNPTDFWRITDSYEQTVPFKLRALGISEALLSGDASYSNSEMAISTFLQTVKMERDQVTEAVFKRKVLLQIAHANGLTTKREMGASSNSINNVAKYAMPEVVWKQSLSPVNDAAYIDLLNGMADRGIPAPIRTLFAAGGLDFDNIMNNSKADLDDRKKLKDYLDKVKEFAPAPAEQPGSEFGGFIDTTQEVGIGNRDYSDSEPYDLYTELSDGKKQRPFTTVGKKLLKDRYHKETAKALVRVAEERNARIKALGEFS